MNVNTLIDYSSRYSFGHFCRRVKQGKRLSEFLQKYNDSWTKNTHLAGYNILVFKYVKNLCAPASTFCRWRDTVFLHEVSIGRPKEDEKWTFFDLSADFRAF